VGEQNVGGNQQASGGGQDVVPKADFEAKTQEVEKMKQELEDMRLEVFSPAYMEFLDAKEKGGKPKEEAPKKEELPEDIEKMSKKELLERAKQLAKEELRADIDKAKTDAIDTVGKETRQKEVAAFARGHEDFETYRPIMYGLSLNQKNKDLSLQELYDLSKEHVKRIHTEPSPEEKARQAKLASEKPGGDNQSFEKYQKMPAEQVAKESLEEVKAKLGPIPQV
jgi:hypothetical protein